MARSRGFPWVKGCFLLLPLIAGTLLAYDVQKSGSFEKSTSGVFLKNVGALETCQYAWSRSLAASARGYKWAEKNTPYYYHCVVEAGRPYAELTRDMFILGVNNACTLYGNIKEYAVEKAPVVYSAIDHYVPGFLSTVQAYSVKAWNVVRDYQSYYCEIVATYLKTKVFIDNWAPELIQARTLQALNTTQLYAAQYYNWFYKHVDDYSKIQ